MDYLFEVIDNLRPCCDLQLGLYELSKWPATFRTKFHISLKKNKMVKITPIIALVAAFAAFAAGAPYNSDKEPESALGGELTADPPLDVGVARTADVRLEDRHDFFHEVYEVGQSSEDIEEALKEMEEERKKLDAIFDLPEERSDAIEIAPVVVEGAQIIQRSMPPKEKTKEQKKKEAEAEAKRLDEEMKKNAEAIKKNTEEIKKNAEEKKKAKKAAEKAEEDAKWEAHRKELLNDDCQRQLDSLWYLTVHTGITENAGTHILDQKAYQCRMNGKFKWDYPRPVEGPRNKLEDLDPRTMKAVEAANLVWTEIQRVRDLEFAAYNGTDDNWDWLRWITA